MLDQVIERSTVLNEASIKSTNTTIVIMHTTSIVGLSLALICLVSLVLYVLKHIVKPLLSITEKAKPLQEGRLQLDLQYSANN